MRALQLRVVNPQIEINGIPFSLKLDDLALYTRAQEELTALSQFGDEPQTPQTVLAALHRVTALLEETLGEGAVRAIAGDCPVSLPLAIEWLGLLAQEAAEHAMDTALQED